MIYAVIGLAVVFAGVTLYQLISSRADRKDARAAMAAERIAGIAQLHAERNQLEAERQRDEAIVKAATAQASADKAMEQLATTQAALNAATGRLTEHIEKQVLGASPAQIASIVSDLLGSAILPGPGGK